MKDIIVFISKDIDSATHEKIAEILRDNQIKTTHTKEQANVILTNKQIKHDLMESLRDAVAQLVINTPVVLLPTYTDSNKKPEKRKNFIQTNINIQRFNKIKKNNQIRITNRTKCK